MLTRRLFISCTALLAIGGWAMQSSQAQGSQTAGATRFVEDLGSKAVNTLAKANLTKDEADRQFRTLLNQGFDVETIGRFVLGRYWPLATPEQQKEYLRLFENMIVQTYAARFRQYSGEKLQVNGARPEGATDFMVQSQIIRPSGPPVNVEWRVRQTGSSHKIIDVFVEGVSMSVTQRSEFASVIQSRGNIDGLLDAMRQRVGTVK